MTTTSRNSDALGLYSHYFFRPFSQISQHLHHTNHTRPELRPAPASPDGSGPDSERLPSPERERRQALEYEEEEVPPEMAIEVKEAEVKFPNLPVPKPSDGNVRVFHLSRHRI
jgi:hypothetical protein